MEMLLTYTSASCTTQKSNSSLPPGFCFHSSVCFTSILQVECTELIFFVFPAFEKIFRAIPVQADLPVESLTLTSSFKSLKSTEHGRRAIAHYRDFIIKTLQFALLILSREVSLGETDEKSEDQNAKSQDSTEKIRRWAAAEPKNTPLQVTS